MTQISLSKWMKKVEAQVDAVRDEFLRNVADSIVNLSPVKTGAYVSSHSITTSSGAGGRQASKGKPKLANGQAAKEEARGKLYGQISALPEGSTTVFVANRSPHASVVEYGGYNKVPPHLVYSTTRDKANELLSAAIAKVRTK